MLCRLDECESGKAIVGAALFNSLLGTVGMDWAWKERAGGLGVLRRGGVGRLGFVERSESTACSSIGASEESA